MAGAMIRPRIQRDERRYLTLLSSMLVLFVVPAFLPRWLARGLPLDVVISAVLLAGLWNVSHKRQTLVIGTALIVPALGMKWVLHLVDNIWLGAFGLACAAAFFGFVAVVLLMQVLRERQVTGDTILGGICVYLLMALMWGLLYTLIEYVSPGSFAMPEGVELRVGNQSLVPQLGYYSIVTLTTLGFGDIRPVTEPAQVLTGLEALAGPLYLAVLIARLVGRVADRKDREGTTDEQ